MEAGNVSNSVAFPKGNRTVINGKLSPRKTAYFYGNWHRRAFDNEKRVLKGRMLLYSALFWKEGVNASSHIALIVLFGWKYWCFIRIMPFVCFPTFLNFSKQICSWAIRQFQFSLNRKFKNTRKGFCSKMYRQMNCLGYFWHSTGLLKKWGLLFINRLNPYTL